MRLLVAALVSVAFIAAWVAIAWLVMLATLYIVRMIPMAGRRAEEKQPRNTQSTQRN
ncbi:MAG TPA: hypothetical protein VKE96_15675 [Vicinamibacterales bacterium]|nr:hypothetical protein [Vicinamibacterales bacterium]